MRGSRWAALALAACVIAAPPVAGQPRNAAQSAYQAMANQNAMLLKQQQLAYQNALRAQQQAQAKAASQIMAYQKNLQQQQQQAAKLQADALAIKQGQQKEITSNPAAYSPARLAQIRLGWQTNSLALQRQAVAGEAALLAQEQAVLARQGIQAPPGLNTQLQAMQQRLAVLNASLQKLGVGSGGGGGGGNGCAAAAAAAGGDGGSGCGGEGGGD